MVDLLIIYLNFRNLPLTLIIFSQIPIAIFGGMIGLGIYGIEMNTAIWVGLIAIIGIAEDDGVVIATYMEQLFARRPMRTVADIRNATVEAGRRRIRPCLMTAFTTFAALLPVMLATGRGSDVARDRPAGLLRHVRGIGVPLRGAGPVLRLHGNETEPRSA